MSKFKRRKFVTNSLSLSLLHPVFKSLELNAATKAPPRLIIWFTPLGIPSNLFWPKKITNESDFDKPDLLAALNPILSDTTIIKGLSTRVKNGSHAGGMAETLTGDSSREIDGESTKTSAHNISIDNILKGHMGGNRVYLNVHPGDPKGNLGVLSWDGRDMPSQPIIDPNTAWNRYFRDFAGNPSTDISDEEHQALQKELQRISKNKKSVLDLIRRDYKKLEMYAGTEEKIQLDRHLDGLNDLEKSIQVQSSAPGAITSLGTCAKPANPSGFGRDLGKIGDIFENMMVQSLNCGITRLGILQWLGGGQSAHLSPVGTSHHSDSHDMSAKGADRLKQIHLWYTNRLIGFTNALKNIQDVDGSSMLDNTVILCVSDISDGQRNIHTRDNMPFRLIGGKNLGLKGNRILEYNINKSQMQHQQLLVSVAKMMELDLPGIGDKPNCGELPRLIVG